MAVKVSVVIASLRFALPSLSRFAVVMDAVVVIIVAGIGVVVSICACALSLLSVSLWSLSSLSAPLG